MRFRQSYIERVSLIATVWTAKQFRRENSISNMMMRASSSFSQKELSTNTKIDFLHLSCRPNNLLQKHSYMRIKCSIIKCGRFVTRPVLIKKTLISLSFSVMLKASKLVWKLDFVSRRFANWSPSIFHLRK